MDNGGPAFPKNWISQKTDDQGMSLRDYFAAAALPALIAASDRWPSITRDNVVGEAYNYADAMLEARK
jgi:hypothetical protein